MSPSTRSGTSRMALVTLPLLALVLAGSACS